MLVVSMVSMYVQLFTGLHPLKHVMPQGRLGSLGTIPEKYDVAVSTACGALNNLIVDTVEQRSGLHRIPPPPKYWPGVVYGSREAFLRQAWKRSLLLKNVPRLFDLIKPKEPRFAAAFYKGVRDTLVADDLDQANRIAFGGQKRWRVVTLAGQLMMASGTMSGGGTTYPEAE